METLFKGLKSLQELDLANSTLEVIEDETFRHLPHLRKLDLSYNPVLFGICNGTLMGLNNLEELNMAYSSEAFSDKTDQKEIINPVLNVLQNLKILSFVTFY